MQKRILLAAAAFIFALAAEAQNDLLQKGSPGPAPVIRIRDGRSVPAAEPLVIVDNFITDMKSMVLNPSRIESISVLKDASATALYGAKGADGVVIIKTKPGTEFYTVNDFVNAEKNASVQKVKLDDTVLPDMKKLLVEKTSLKQTALSSGFGLDETCKAVSQDMLVVTTTADK